MRLASPVSRSHFTVVPRSASALGDDREGGRQLRRLLETAAKRPGELGQLARFGQTPVQTVEDLAHPVGGLVFEQGGQPVASEVVAAHGCALKLRIWRGPRATGEPAWSSAGTSVT